MILYHQVGLVSYILISLYSTGTCNGSLSPVIREYIAKLISVYKANNGMGLCGIIPAPVELIRESDSDISEVILWNPYVVYPDVFPLNCTLCGNLMHETYWNDGSSTAKQPRVLHGLNDKVLLVSAVYSCEKRHKILAHDEVVLKQLPSHLIPFCLLHRTGFTRELFDTCQAFCRQGINFYCMETLIIERRWENFVRKQYLRTMNTERQVSCSYTEFLTSPMSQTPSNDVLSKCFIAGFLQNEELYLREMTAIPVTDSISFDHTFKVASNIGYLREDKKWISVYDSLMLVLNGDGKVLSWQFTKGTSFLEVTSLLQDIARRAQNQLKLIYVDDCCKLRNKIREIFGYNVTVKLDLFHAIQRITKTLSKKHSHYQQCIQDLRLIFRCTGDYEISRLFNTPSIEIIQKNMDNFVTKWEKITDVSGEKLFKPQTIIAIENLKRHIATGCLSDIPPGGGTNRNERLHEHINKYFNRSRIGILLAYSLLHMILYTHNSSKTINGKRIIRPIATAHLTSTPDPIKSSIPIGIMPKHRELLTEQHNCHHWEKDFSENCADLSLLVPVYHNSLKKYQVMNNIIKEKLMQGVFKIASFKEFKPGKMTETISDKPKNTAKLEIESYGLTIISVSPDGNCFFAAIAMNIKLNPNLNFEAFGKTECIVTMCTKLRQAFVLEITGERRSIYENFIQIDERNAYLDEANKFLQNGYFASVLGDLMPLAMATILNVNIIIFIRNYHSPMYVTSLTECSEKTILLIYDPEGPGHYDAALPYSYLNNQSNKASVESEVKSVTSQVSCSCGVNKNNSTSSCAPNPLYASRCKCYKSGKPCNSSCRCKHCCNPYGVKPCSEEKPKRQRRNHSLQSDIPSSKKFAEDRGEKVESGVWSTFECIVLNEVQQVAEEISDVDIVKLYNDTKYYTNSNFCTLPLPENIVFRFKTKPQISGKLLHTKQQN